MFYVRYFYLYLNYNRLISVLECLSDRILEDIFSLCVHQYSEVRILAQEVFHKIIGKRFSSSFILLLTVWGGGGGRRWHKIDSSIISEVESSIFICKLKNSRTINYYPLLYDHHAFLLI